MMSNASRRTLAMALALISAPRSAAIQGKDFQPVLLSIWLGPEPPSEGMKRAIPGSQGLR